MRSATRARWCVRRRLQGAPLNAAALARAVSFDEFSTASRSCLRRRHRAARRTAAGRPSNCRLGASDLRDRAALRALAGVVLLPAGARACGRWCATAMWSRRRIIRASARRGRIPISLASARARAVIDSVRVARTMPGAGGGSRFAVWGHSQGGHAALFTGLIAKSYAPELTLVGVAAAAPASELAPLMDDDLDTPAGKNITCDDALVLAARLSCADGSRRRSARHAGDRQTGAGMCRRPVGPERAQAEPRSRWSITSSPSRIRATVSLGAGSWRKIRRGLYRRTFRCSWRKASTMK